MAWGDDPWDPYLGYSSSAPVSDGNWGGGGAGTTTDDPSSFPLPPVPSAGMQASPDQPVIPSTTGGVTGGAPASHGLATALQKLGDAFKGNQNTPPPPAQSVHSAPPQVSSQMSRGSSSGLDSLVQALQRRQYLPIGYTASGGTGIRGLLGY